MPAEPVAVPDKAGLDVLCDRLFNGQGWAWQDAAQRYERCFAAARREAVEELVREIEAERQPVQ